MIARTLWALPVVVLLGLFAWALAELPGIPVVTAEEASVAVLLLGLAATFLGIAYDTAFLRRLGLAILLLTYFGTHVTALRLDATAALAFLALALLSIELRILAERFVPLYTGHLEGADRERVGEALQRSLVRVASVCGVAFAGSVLTADLALAGTFPLTTAPTALLLAAALIGVIVVLALWPLLQRRAA